MTKIVFIAGLLVAASGFVSPAIALALGLAFGFAFTHPYQTEAHKGSKILLQLSVIGLGFGMNVREVLQVGRSGLVYTAASITFALVLGWVLGNVLQVKSTISYLISSGTAICGGSAIAAISPIAGASEEEIAVSLGTVFLLNSVALLLFPFIGTRLHMTQSQFGLWSALAIHDTSSVVGATARFGAVALAVGTTVKLARALWIVPLSLGTAMARRSSARIQWPWFIVLFAAAAMANSYLPRLLPVYSLLRHASVLGLTATLYLIGSGLSLMTIRSVGARPLIQGVALWAVVATGTLLLIRCGWVHL